MVRLFLISLFIAMHSILTAGIVEMKYHFREYKLQKAGGYDQFMLPGTKGSGIPGEPMIPWKCVMLALPPGEEAISAELVLSDENGLKSNVILHPAQHVVPLSAGGSGEFVMNHELYRSTSAYPACREGKLMNQQFAGVSFALFSFTPVTWFPGTGKLTWFETVTVRITTRPVSLHSLVGLAHPGESDIRRARALADNPAVIDLYRTGYSPLTSYQYLVLSPVVFKNEFQALVNLQQTRGLTARVVALDSVYGTSVGFDAAEKIRNFIIAQRNNHQVQYVLLAGNPPLMPCRYLHCSVQSGGVYTDSLPADLYYAALDGNFDANGNHKYGELADSADLLPELSVGRFTVNDTAELRKMIRKTIAYSLNPVRGEFAKPLMAGEYLYNNPITFGADYMDLLIDDHSDNGYFTHGIPSATNQVYKLYDTLVTPPPSFTYWSWNSTLLLNSINQGNSFIHHLGHANTNYMLRLSSSAITNASFSQVDGTTHNYQLLYTQGCYCGAFDYGCIAAKAVKIDNWLVAGVFNSRYGWFNQGTTDGPSQHLQREFVSAMYNDTTPERHLGTAHSISKIKTAPFVSLPGEFEPGAQRWCHYCCNLFGDPALSAWTTEPATFAEFTWTGSVDSDWHKPGNWSTGLVPGSACNVTIAPSSHPPVINTTGVAACNDLTIDPGAGMVVLPGKSVRVHGNVSLLEEAR